MAAIGIVGRDVTVTVGGSAVLGTVSKGWTFNNEVLDVTDDNSSGWQELLSVSGRKSIEFTMSGDCKNLELVKAFFGTSQKFAVACTYPDGSTLTFDAFMNSVGQTGESNGKVTFDASFASSGVPVFTAGV